MSQISIHTPWKTYNLNSEASRLLENILKSDNNLIKALLSLLTIPSYPTSSISNYPENRMEEYKVKYPRVSKKVFLYEPKKAYTYLVNGEETVIISICCQEIIEQSLALNADSVMSHIICDYEKIAKQKLIRTENFYITTDNIYYRFTRIRGCKRERKIAQSKFFVFDKKVEKDFDTEVEIVKKIVELLNETGAIMAGSYPLSKFHTNIEPEDIDIFSFTLEFLRKFLEYFFEKEESRPRHRMIFRRVNEIESYKFILYDGEDEIFKLNFVHFAINPDLTHPEDIKLDAEENRSKTLRRISENFDNTVCMTSYDGKSFHFNDLAINGGVVYGRNLFQHRIEKYTERGYTLIQPPDVSDEDNKAIEFYISKNNYQKKIMTG